MQRRDDSAGEGRSLLVNDAADKISQEKRSNKEPGYGSAISKGKESLEEHQMFLQDGRRLPCLDIARVVCVGLVVVNHGGSSWSDQFGLYNEMYVQQWVLQWLFIVCGMSFGMSSRNTYGYLGRLLMYFAIGSLTNWCAWAIKGMDWKRNFWNVIFQFWFIFGLMLYIVVLAPLKRYLKDVSTRTHLARDLGLVNGLVIIAGALVVVHIGFKLALEPLVDFTFARALVELRNSAGPGGQFWGLPGTIAESSVFCEELLGYFKVSAGSLVILYVFPKVSNHLPLTNWLVLLNVFIFRCFTFRGQFARVVDGFDFTMIGLANFYLGLSYRRTIGKYMCRYWFFVLFVFSLLVPPGTWGRFDEVSIHDMSFRMRFHSIELALVLLFLCAAERLADGAIFFEDKLMFLSWWALYLFLFHEFIHLVVPHPYNWVVLIMLAPMAWFIHGRSDGAVSEPDAKSSGQSAQPASGSGTQESLAEPKAEPHVDVERALECEELSARSE